MSHIRITENDEVLSNVSQLLDSKHEVVPVLALHLHLGKIKKKKLQSGKNETGSRKEPNKTHGQSQSS